MAMGRTEDADRRLRGAMRTSCGDHGPASEPLGARVSQRPQLFQPDRSNPDSPDGYASSSTFRRGWMAGTSTTTRRSREIRTTRSVDGRCSQPSSDAHTAQQITRRLAALPAVGHFATPDPHRRMRLRYPATTAPFHPMSRADKVDWRQINQPVQLGSINLCRR